MSVIGMMQPSASGMSAQSNRLSTVADNVANASTVGYKRADAQFASLLFEQDRLYYTGVVETNLRHLVDIQGPLKPTTSSTDLAVQGKGFFVVTYPESQTSTVSSTQIFLTRAGSFVEDGNTGCLINTAGFQLMGYDITNGAAPSGPASPSGLTPVDLQAIETLDPTASTSGVLTMNLDATKAVVTGNTPADNQADSAYTSETSLAAYDSSGDQVTLDIYLTRLTNTPPYQWQAAVFDHADASVGATPFPYGAAGSAPLAQTTLAFDLRGQYVSGSPVNIPVPGGSTVSLDMSGSTQLASPFMVVTGTTDGNTASTLDHVEVTKDGTVKAVYANGVTRDSYQIPLANVLSENNLTVLPGNVFQASDGSGDVQVWQATMDGNGEIYDNYLEQSTVDVALELTDMVIAQRAFEANSKAFQVGAETTQTLINLR